MEQPNRFQKLVARAKQNITEISPADARKQAEAGGAILVDVREESDWREGHAQGARNLSRGEIELEIEEQVPDVTKPIICYCGGGSRECPVDGGRLQSLERSRVADGEGVTSEW